MDVPPPSPRFRRIVAPIAAVAALAAAGSGLSAQEVPSGARDVPALEAAPRSGPVEVDGRLREAAWEGAPVADDFVQSRPREGSEPARRTAVRVLFDGEALYVGARLHDDPGAVRDQLVRRDGAGAYDFFRVELWSVVERPPEGVEIHVVKAEDSDVLSEEACRRVERAEEAHGRTRLHRLEGGHWLNVANPDGLIDLLTRRLPR